MLAACPDGIRALADENARWPLGISIGRVPDRGIGKLMIPPADSQQSAGLRGPDGRISPATSTLYTWKNGSDASPARQILRLGNPDPQKTTIQFAVRVVRWRVGLRFLGAIAEEMPPRVREHLWRSDRRLDFLVTWAGG